MSISKRIVLIDGVELSALMVRNIVGVRKRGRRGLLQRVTPLTSLAHRPRLVN